MSDYNWCHGTECHEYDTQDRVRGVGDNKVLRTRKLRNQSHSDVWNYFCSNRCYDDFAQKYIQQIVAIAPRREALETPVKVEKTKYPERRETNGYVWQAHTYTKITKLDNGQE